MAEDALVLTLKVTSVLTLNFFELYLELQGEKLHWLACALYVSCRKGVTPTVGGGRGSYIEGNCVSLTRLLRSCSLR